MNNALLNFNIAKVLYKRTNNPYMKNPKVIGDKCKLCNDDGDVIVKEYNPCDNTDTMISYLGKDLESLTKVNDSYLATCSNGITKTHSKASVALGLIFVTL